MCVTLHSADTFFLSEMSEEQIEFKYLVSIYQNNCIECFFPKVCVPVPLEVWSVRFSPRGMMIPMHVQIVKTFFYPFSVVETKCQFAYSWYVLNFKNVWTNNININIYTKNDVSLYQSKQLHHTCLSARNVKFAWL